MSTAENVTVRTHGLIKVVTLAPGAHTPVLVHPTRHAEGSPGFQPTSNPLSPRGEDERSLVEAGSTKGFDVWPVGTVEKVHGLSLYILPGG